MNERNVTLSEKTQLKSPGSDNTRLFLQLLWCNNAAVVKSTSAIVYTDFHYAINPVDQARL